MFTSIDRAAAHLPGCVSIHRVRPDDWLRRPSHLIGRGPWLPRPWPASVTLQPIALAFRSFLAEHVAARTRAQLHQLAGGMEPILVNETGKAPLLLRRMLAEWFQAELGESVPERDGALTGSATLLGFDP